MWCHPAQNNPDQYREEKQVQTEDRQFEGGDDRNSDRIGHAAAECEQRQYGQKLQDERDQDGCSIKATG